MYPNAFISCARVDIIALQIFLNPLSKYCVMQIVTLRVTNLDAYPFMSNLCPRQCLHVKRNFEWTKRVRMQWLHHSKHNVFRDFSNYWIQISKQNVQVCFYAVTKCPAAGQGLKLTRYPAVKSFHAISAGRFFQTSWEYEVFVNECQAIPNVKLVF